MGETTEKIVMEENIWAYGECINSKGGDKKKVWSKLGQVIKSLFGGG